MAEVRVDGTTVPLKTNGSFEWQGFVPWKLSVVVEAIDTGFGCRTAGASGAW